MRTSTVLSRRRFGKAATAAAFAAYGRAQQTAGRRIPAKVSNVNSTDLFAAASLGCGTMGRIFNADDHEIPFFGSEVWPNAELSFNNSHSESQVPGRQLNARLTAEHVFGIQAAEEVIEKHARAAFFSYTGPIAVPLNRDRIGGLARPLPAA